MMMKHYPSDILDASHIYFEQKDLHSQYYQI